ncbi:MAG: hypothetical protein JKX85_15605, partial [Phycisphaeraceae bacterium]|nr:hypothetical protein [Phycisphaeraceae bacterium]
MNSPTARWLHQISPCASIQPAGFAARSLCDATITPADWIEPKRVIYDHELVLFQQGQYRIQLDDQFYDCPENTFIIIPPNRWHITTCTQKGKRHYAHFNWQHETHKADSPVMTFFPARPKRSCFRLAPQIIPS